MSEKKISEIEEQEIEIETTNYVDSDEQSQASDLKGIKKLINFIKTHETIKQLILFTMFSLICFLIEYVSYTIIHYVWAAKNEEPFQWFVFTYESGGIGEFMAFLISNILAQIATFVLNRKTTFKADNNIVYAAVMYAIMVAGIIVLNTWLGGVLTDAISRSMTANGSEEKLARDIGGYVGKFAGSFASFVISFVMSKFVIMRKKKPASDTVADSSAAEDQPKEEETY